MPGPAFSNRPVDVRAIRNAAAILERIAAEQMLDAVVERIRRKHGLAARKPAAVPLWLGSTR